MNFCLENCMDRYRTTDDILCTLLTLCPDHFLIDFARVQLSDIVGRKTRR